MFGEREVYLKNYRPPLGCERWKLQLSWQGGGFVGWQIQPQRRSVQETVWQAVQPLLHLPDDSLNQFLPVAAGRTDAGVHAEDMTAHLDVRIGSIKPAAVQLARAINAYLPPDLAVTKIVPAPPNFHARFSCTERRYIYRVLTTKQRRPLWEGRALHHAQPLDITAMQQAAALLIGKHDFAAFATQEERQSVRELRRLELHPAAAGLDLLEFQIAGESFLRQMVRGLVGTLLKVGSHQLSAAQLQDILVSRQRSNAGANAPAYGLYFSGAEYGMRGIESD